MQINTCKCGCGQTTSLITKNSFTQGLVKGAFRKYLKGHSNRVPVRKRFWKYVNKNGPFPHAAAVLSHPEIKGTRCWVWTGVKNRGLYGMIDIDNRTLYVHRVAWFLRHGKWPVHDMNHKCDTPACVRTLHLFDGKESEGSADMITKGRAKHPSGKLHPQYKHGKYAGRKRKRPEGTI